MKTPPAAVTPEVRQFLDNLDDALMKLSFDDRHNVLNVLSALRGPDEEISEDLFKGRSTVVIREAAFPKVFNIEEDNVFLDMNYERRSDVAIRMNHRGGPLNHFHSHLKHAAQALGLPVVEVLK